MDTGTAPPSLPDASDEEMADAPPTRESSVGDVAQDDPDDDPEVKPEPVPEPDEEAAPSPAPELDAPEEPYTPRGGRTSAIPRKRRLGRPPKNRPPDWDLPDDPNAESQIRVTTPVKRRRGRPAASGGRWGRRGGTPHVTKVAVDKEGTMLDVVDDEVVLPDDPDGETKVDKMGNLLGGRQYRVRTFTILNRDDRKYMLSTEPARCIGFRDSYLFFQKHKLLYKIIIDDDAKRDLIERDIIPHSYKGRAIGVVTARSVFREFGAKIVIGGRKVNDDYTEQAARERGDVEGELAVPEDKLPAPGEEYNRNQYVAWHGASAVYHTGAPSVPLPNGKIVDPKKRKVTVTGDNWMIEHAREARSVLVSVGDYGVVIDEACSRYNSSTASLRRDNLDGVYDVHTNFMHYPKIMQPSHARWERLPPADSTASSKLMDGMSTLRLSNGTSGADEESPAAHGEHEENESSEENPSMFAPVPSMFTRRFAITDIQYETAESSTLGRPGPDGDVHDIGVNGVISMADPLHPEFVSADVLAELPLDCKDALVDAAAREWEWKSKWRTEATDAARSAPLKSYSWYP
jgi:chromatin structure-remodeling complex protein RSC7